jgi:type VI secretion system secreted protein Hcp
MPVTKKLLALALPAVIAAAVAANDSPAQTPRAAPEITALIDGIAGESTTRAGEIDVKSFSFGGRNTPNTGSGGGGKVQFSNLRFSKHYDSASPALMVRMASGQHIKSVTFRFARLTYKLSDVVVVGYEQGGDDNPPLLEHVELSFAKVQVAYQPLNGGPPITAGWDVKGNVSV